jgi:hypothetical protein
MVTVFDFLIPTLRNDPRIATQKKKRKKKTTCKKILVGKCSMIESNKVVLNL